MIDLERALRGEGAADDTESGVMDSMIDVGWGGLNGTQSGKERAKAQPYLKRLKAKMLQDAGI